MHSWIVALPRLDLIRCIELGSFGMERSRDRVSEVNAGDGIAFYVVKESIILALGKVTRGYYYDESPKFLKEGVFGHRFDFQAQLLTGKEISVSTLGQLTSIPPGGNFGLLVKSGFRSLTREDWNLICRRAELVDLQAPADDKSTLVHHQWWWVNQGQTFRPERNGGYIWAPQKGKNGQPIFHHLNVSRVKAGDSIWHYVDGRIVATGVAETDAALQAKPAEFETEPWGNDGYTVKVRYRDLARPIFLTEIPYELRTALGAESKSPFTRNGTVNQGYMFALNDRFVAGVTSILPELIPPGQSAPRALPLAPSIESSLQDFLDAIINLRVDKDQAGSPRLYKPAALLAIVEAADANDLKVNNIGFDWLVPRFKQVLARFGLTGEEKQAAAAFFHMQNEGFWRLSLKDEAKPALRGEPAHLRELVSHAYLTEPFWSVLSDTAARERVQQAILDRWFSEARMTLSSIPFDRAQAAAHLILSIQKTGFRFEPWQIACYLAAMRTKPFLILAGVSGSGKCQVPQLVAAGTGSNCTLVPVRPDWTDSSDILGYSPLQGPFRPGRLLEVARNASLAADKHFICVIDEMNLARVEHYFAEVLSRIEELRSSGLHSGPLLSQPLPEQDKLWQEVSLKPNVALVGTVNMDESTQGFSKKVLDRAFTLEFSEIDLTIWETDEASIPETSWWPAHAWQARATRLPMITNVTTEERKEIVRVIEVLVAINEILRQGQLQLAYRSRDEIVLFVLHANEILASFVTTNGENVDPLDLALQMKVLPRIAGGSGVVRRVVLELLGWAFEGAIFESEDEAKGLMERWVSLRKPHSMPQARFPRTCARLCLMWERILNEGYTSFWL